ncbi:hypothetical protein MHU86_25059 [Fragilaria crotonensis]|nr:hypothetical protein MHU86_25059 [Fragilaria crotonensis]
MVPGRENKVADILSRDFALDDDEVTSLIRKHGSPFVPQNFRIIPLQPALISQIGDWLRLLPKTQLLPTQPAPSAAAAGTATHDSSSESESTSTLSPPVRTKRKDGNLRVFRCRPSGRTASLQTACDRWQWSHVRYHSCHPRRCGSDLQA